MVYEFSCSAKLTFNILQLSWRLMCDIFYITGSGLSCGLVFFNMTTVSVMLYMNNPVSSSLLQIPFSMSLVLKIYSVSDFEVRCRLVCSLLCKGYTCVSLFPSCIAPNLQYIYRHPCSSPSNNIVS